MSTNLFIETNKTSWMLKTDSAICLHSDVSFLIINISNGKYVINKGSTKNEEEPIDFCTSIYDFEVIPWSVYGY